MEQVILVNEEDQEVGVGEKLRVHQDGKLHRAFSIFVFDSAGRLLLQKRALSKYHSAGLWSNTCCGHPRPGETVQEAAHRRLEEEMSFDCRLQLSTSFIYRVELENNLTEWEYDHILIGVHDQSPDPNRLEVSDWEWLEMERLRDRLEKEPGLFTYWLKIALDRLGAADHRISLL